MQADAPKEKAPRARRKRGCAGSPSSQKIKIKKKTYSVTLVALFFRMTSWLPPSTMLVEETTVRRAFYCSSGMVSAPQLHMVLRTLESVTYTPSFSAPAYGT